jgi:small ubiquitin-related modifier
MRVWQVIKISVQDAHSVRTHFKIKKSTPLGKVFKAYAQKQGIPLDSLRFSYDGDRLDNFSTTAETLGLEDGDIIDANVAQVGGQR